MPSTLFKPPVLAGIRVLFYFTEGPLSRLLLAYVHGLRAGYGGYDLGILESGTVEVNVETTVKTKKRAKDEEVRKKKDKKDFGGRLLQPKHRQGVPPGPPAKHHHWRLRREPVREHGLACRPAKLPRRLGQAVRPARHRVGGSVSGPKTS